MEIIKVENLTFTYLERKTAALNNINFTVNSGEFITVCGKSGCGKSTLLRLLKTAISPFGDLKGEIYFKGELVSQISPKEQATKIGFVMQNPDNQIVTDKVWHELAFGLESLGVKTSEIRGKVSEMASFFGIEEWFHKNITELSGGQKQLVNLASVMVMAPELLILDEPTSQLDPIAASEFFNMLCKINRELGITIILCEHRLEEAFAVSDRVIVMDSGKIIADDVPVKVGRILKNQNHPMYKALPAPMRVHIALENSCNSPVTVRDGRMWLEEYTKTHIPNTDVIPSDEIIQGKSQVELKNIWFRYEKNLPDVIKDLNLTIYEGEFFAILGGNGSGKTTALNVVSGINKPYLGQVLIKGKKLSEINNLYDEILGVLPQNPQSVFVKKTVRLDLEDMLINCEMSQEQKRDYITHMARLCNIEDKLDFHPYDLSGGEMQKAALCKVLLKSPKILLLDEPTKGLDAHFKSEFAGIIANLKSNGVTIIMVSHDVEFCAEYATRCALFFDGNITCIGTPREFFCGKKFYTTTASRMARTTIPSAVLSQDIILSLGGCAQKESMTSSLLPRQDMPKRSTKQEKKKKLRIEPWFVSIIFFLLVIPLTILSGMYFSYDRKYYITSFLIIFETIFPFLYAFEKRKPTARFLVLVSVLCAIAVVGRGAFFMLPQFKPVVAIVIISAVAFGAETGCLVGVVSAFVSNFFFGHGPWTPWQMFAFGIIGFVSGLVFAKDFVKKTRFNLSVFGFFATLLIYGGIMNPASVLMWQEKITLQMIVASYLTGFSVDIIHAISSFVFLWFISQPMLENLERLKTKYGV